MAAVELIAMLPTIHSIPRQHGLFCSREGLG